MAKKQGKPVHKNKSKGPLGGGPKQNSLQMKAKEVERILSDSERRWKKGDTIGALELLENGLVKHPRESRLMFLSAVLYAELGDMQEALERAKIADELDPDEPLTLSFLSNMYLANGREAHSLSILRHLRSVDEDGEFYNADERQRFELMERLIGLQAEQLGVSAVTMEKAMLVTEDGEDLCEEGDFDEGIAKLQEASRMVPKWTAPLVSISLHRFQQGQAEAAIASAQKVINDIDPNDFSALNQLVTLLAWTRQPEQASPYIELLHKVFEEQVTEVEQSEIEAERLGAILLYSKMAGAYAALEQDQQVYDVLKQAEKAKLEFDPYLYRMLGTAAFNLGKSAEMQQYWDKIELDDVMGFDSGLRMALKRPSPADATFKLPYFDTAEYVPMTILGELLSVTADEEDDEDEVPEFDSEVINLTFNKYNLQYKLKEALLQNAAFGLDPVAEANIGLLGEIDSEEVTNDLKDFALGYLGSETVRRFAVAILVDREILPKDGGIRFWVEKTGEWQNLKISSFPTLEEENERILSSVLQGLEDAE